MRVASVLVLSACFSGCTLSEQRFAYEQCSINKREGWVHSELTAALSDELLSLTYKGKTIREWLDTESPRREAWFLKGPDRLLLCSYLPERDACSRMLETVEFNRSGDEWHAGVPMEEICVTSGDGHGRR